MSDNGDRAFWSIVAATTTGQALLTGSLCCVAALVARHFGASHSATAWTQLLPALALLTLAALGAGLALVRAALETRALRTLHRSKRSRQIAPPTVARRAASDAGLDGRLDVIASDIPFALTYGLLTPTNAATCETEIHSRCSSPGCCLHTAFTCRYCATSAPGLSPRVSSRQTGQRSPRADADPSPARCSPPWTAPRGQTPRQPPPPAKQSSLMLA